MTEMHWVITIQWVHPGNGSNEIAMDHGTIAAGGRTRQQMFNELFGRTAARSGAPVSKTAVLFFSLEPNHIGESAA
jgi:hypothetical protein